MVVDYKNDSIWAKETADSVERYRIQGGAYALALQQVAGKPVKEVVFLFLQTRREEILRDVTTLQAQGKSAAESFLIERDPNRILAT